MLVYQVIVNGVSAASGFAAVDISHVYDRMLPGDQVTGAIVIAGTNGTYPAGSDVAAYITDHVTGLAGSIGPYTNSNMFVFVNSGVDLSNTNIALTLQRPE